jgi:cytochrome c oxidase cbb3-type subunit 3
MKHATRLLILALAATTLPGCDARKDGPPVEPPVLAPDKITDFAVLYRSNCTGCHGPEGEGGVALGLNNAIYLEIADDGTLRRATADGVAGTAMPAFSQAAGGQLTDAQIDIVVQGIRTRWGQNVVSDLEPPPYSTHAVGDPVRGAQVYRQFCLSCHGDVGRGARAGSIVDASYLALVSDQSLRTTLIAGRPDLGHPDWRGAVPGTPMSSEDISNVVAWLASQRLHNDQSPQARAQK